MEAKVILLINVNALVLISIYSDNWILIKTREALAPPECSIVHQHQYSNLYRQCNDLTEGYRANISNTQQLYETSCYWFLGDITGKWRILETHWAYDLTSFLCAFASLMCNVMAMYKCQHGSLTAVSRVLLSGMALLLIPILISISIIHSTNTRIPKAKSDYVYFAEAGWSLVAASFTVAISQKTYVLLNEISFSGVFIIFVYVASQSFVRKTKKPA